MKIPHPRRLTFTASAGLTLLLLGGLLVVPIPYASAAPAAALKGGNGILDTILNVVRDARNEARDSADSAREMRDRIRNATSSFSSQMQTAIQEAIEDVGRELTEELDGRDEFLATGVEPFRQDLTDLLRGTETLQNTISSIAGGPGDLVDFQRLISVVDSLPGRTLFPLYRVLAADNSVLGSGLLDELQDTITNLQTLGAVIRGEACEFVAENPLLIRASILTVQSFGVRTKLIGGILVLGGKRKFVELQIHGYVGATLESDLAIKLGNGYQALGDLLFWLANFASNRVSLCTATNGFDEVLAGQAELLDGQEHLATREGQQQMLEQQREIKKLLEELLRALHTRFP